MSRGRKRLADRSAVRSVAILVRVREAEREEIRAASEREGAQAGAWIRGIALREARRGTTRK